MQNVSATLRASASMSRSFSQASRRFCRALFFVLLGGGSLLLIGVGSLPDDVKDRLRNRIDTAHQAGSTEVITVGDESLLASQTVAHFYRRQDFEPVWTDRDGPTPYADSLLAVLRDADEDGLRPADYHVSEIESRLQRLQTTAENGDSIDERRLVDFELLSANAFLLYGSHLLTGRVDPVEIVSSWTAGRRQADLIEHLEEALGEEASLRSVLARLRPSQPEYEAFRRALSQYRALDEAGGWPTVPEGPALEEGMQDDRVPVLRRRLQATGDLPDDAASDARTYDDSLRRAVSRFQERHGLDVDGVMGADTRAAMNVSVEDRIRQIEVNLERWRWLPQDLGTPHVLVNIADFWLRVVEDGRIAQQMRVVVGTRYRQTPIFSDEISYLVFNPYWYVPREIAVQDKLPEFQRDPSLVSRRGFEVFEGWGEDARRVDPSTISWDSLTASTFPYRLRQRPGPQNALGQVKFMFPNPHNVYLHDTPERSLFDRQERCFSSGCIRVEYPVELAAYLLRHNEGWTEERIREVMRTDTTEQTVVLERKVPVHLLYMTAWIERGDTVHFREDVYGRDEAVADALVAPLSSSDGDAR